MSKSQLLKRDWSEDIGPKRADARLRESAKALGQNLLAEGPPSTLTRCPQDEIPGVDYRVGPSVSAGKTQ
eukprot:5207078-Prymnesium_polylepis.1